jgi:CRP-like cAMP-binding protein
VDTIAGSRGSGVPSRPRAAAGNPVGGRTASGVSVTSLAALDLHVPGRGWVVIDTLGLGQVIGWSWLLPPYAWAFGAVAVQPTEAFQFDSRVVRERCTGNLALRDELNRRFLAVAAARLQASRTRLVERCAPPENWP